MRSPEIKLEAKADMIFHAAHCSKSGYSTVVIASDEIDVFVLLHLQTKRSVHYSDM